MYFHYNILTPYSLNNLIWHHTILPGLKTVSVEHLILHDLNIYQIIVTIIKHKNYSHYYHHNDYYRKPKTNIGIPQMHIITDYVLLITSHPHSTLKYPDNSLSSCGIQLRMLSYSQRRRKQSWPTQNYYPELAWMVWEETRTHQSVQ